jgi:hypothetical protein
MLLPFYQNVSQNQDIKIANILFENVSQYKYLGTTVTNQNLSPEKIKRRLNCGNDCYHSVQNSMSSCLLSRNVRIHNTMNSLVLYGCESWSLTLRVEHRLTVFEKRVLRMISGPNVDEVTESVEKTA